MKARKIRRPRRGDLLKIRAFARGLGVREGDSARRAVQHAVAAEEIAEGIRRLRARGTFVDAYERAPK
jgi:hypothetical protein